MISNLIIAGTVTVSIASLGITPVYRMIKPKNLLRPLFYRYKFWMRDVGVFAGEYSVAGRFVNEAMNISILLTVKGYDIGWLGIIGLYLAGLILMGLLGRMLRKAQIPHLTNTLQNEMNTELMEIIERLKRIEEKQDK